SQQRLVYSVDFNGSERYELRVRDLDSGRDVDTVPNVYYGVAWGDDDTLFYTRPDDAMRPFQVWRHVVGTPADDDVLVWQDDDERFDVWVHRSRSDAFVIFGADSRTTSEAWIVPTSAPRSAPRLVAARRDGVEYHVDHCGDALLIWTNDEGA